MKVFDPLPRLDTLQCIVISKLDGHIIYDCLLWDFTFFLQVMLNSHWGKFGQRPNKDKLTYVADPATYVKMMTDEAIEVTDLMFVNQENIGVKWRSKDDFVEALSNTNVVLAAFTTAQARLKLYELLERLDDRVLYFDTDRLVEYLSV